MFTLKSGLSLLLMFSVRSYIDTEDETTVFWLRIGFYTTQFISLLTYFCIYIYLKYYSEDTTEKKLKVFQSEITPNAFMLDDEEDEELNLTISQYDCIMIEQHLKRDAIILCFTSFLHFYMGLVIPLLGISLLGLFNLSQQPIIQLRLLGANPNSDVKLRRPFKNNAGMSSWMKNWDPVAARRKKLKKSAKKKKKSK